MPKVFLSAGHGGNDPGAVSDGLLEKTVNLNALLACKEALEAAGVSVVCSRTSDVDDPVGEEVAEANASGADVAFSMHANAGGGDGWEAYCWGGDADGVRLAKLCEDHVAKLGQNSRGVKTGNHLWFVNSTNMTAVLVESFFVDNADDRRIGDTVEEQRAFGVAYANAILEYFGIDAQPQPKPEASSGLYRVQVGAYAKRDNAERMAEKLRAEGYDTIVKRG